MSCEKCRRRCPGLIGTKERALGAARSERRHERASSPRRCRYGGQVKGSSSIRMRTHRFRPRLDRGTGVHVGTRRRCRAASTVRLTFQEDGRGPPSEGEQAASATRVRPMPARCRAGSTADSAHPGMDPLVGVRRLDLDLKEPIDQRRRVVGRLAWVGVQADMAVTGRDVKHSPTRTPSTNTPRWRWSLCQADAW